MEKGIFLIQMKIPLSQITSEELQKIFNESQISRRRFFPRKVPSAPSEGYFEQTINKEDYKSKKRDKEDEAALEKS